MWPWKKTAPVRAPAPPLSREWVAVKDQMPPTSHQQILLWNGRFPRLGLCLGLRNMPVSRNNTGFYTFYEERIHDVTHWAPIPEYPQ